MYLHDVYNIIQKYKTSQRVSTRPFTDVLRANSWPMLILLLTLLELFGSFTMYFLAPNWVLNSRINSITRCWKFSNTLLFSLYDKVSIEWSITFIIRFHRPFFTYLEKKNTSELANYVNKIFCKSFGIFTGPVKTHFLTMLFND